MTSPPNPPSSCLFLPVTEERHRGKKSPSQRSPLIRTRGSRVRWGFFRESVPRVKAISTSSFSPRERKRRDDAYDIWIEGCGGKEEEKPKRICQRRESSSTFILPSINIQVCQTFLGHITTVTMVTLMMPPPQAWVSRFRAEEKGNRHDCGAVYHAKSYSMNSG